MDGAAAALPERGGLFGRAMRGGALSAGSYALSQVLRLASNIVLAHLLYPEAFGVMALVTMVMVGLAMFSDTGIGPAITRSARGDDQNFLDTAWTINILRGLLLAALTCAIAWPMARFYQAPDLVWLLPVAGLSLIIGGFNPTRIDTANRHLLIGRLTALDLAAQVISIAVMVAVAVMTHSVAALVIGAVAYSVAKLALTWAYLPGRANRFHWDSAAGAELVQFGKWILLSSACGFMMAQGDKAILGAYLSLQELGIYNIGFTFAYFPILLGGSVVGRIMIPLHRDHPPGESPGIARRISRLRYGISLAVLGMLGLMALVGTSLVDTLYDPRYHLAGVLVTAIAMAQMPGVVGTTYDQSALAAGDGRGYFLLILTRAAAQTFAFWMGAHFAGLGGALLGLGIAFALVHPLIARLAWRHGAWDAKHDIVIGALTMALIAGLWFLFRHDLAALAQ